MRTNIVKNMPIATDSHKFVPKFTNCTAIPTIVARNANMARINAAATPLLSINFSFIHLLVKL